MKYARPILVDGHRRISDVLNTDDYEPKPGWWVSDEAALDKMFAPNKDAWVAAGEWFVQVPGGVQNGATYTGNDYMDPANYLNPDGTNGNGE